MPTSTMLNKNYYSHCPLKKRPIKKETPTIDDHEPENLSTKPGDLHHSHKFMAAFGGDVKSENSQKFAEAPVANFLWPVPGFYPFQLYTALLPHRDLLTYGTSSRAELSRDTSLSPPAPAFIEPPIKSEEKANIDRERVSFHQRLLPSSPTSDHLSFDSFTAQSVPFGRIASAKILTDFKIATLLKSTTEKEKVFEVRKAETMRYHCPNCKRSYSTCSGLVKHQQFHCITSDGRKVQKLVSCEECGKVYASTGALKMHIRTHTLPCKCHLCGKAFSRPWLLQGHIRTHTGEKPFSCNNCHRAFADRSNLRAHLQTHSDVKKYSCSVCNKTFSRMSLLIKHNDSGCPIKLKLA